MNYFKFEFKFNFASISGFSLLTIGIHFYSVLLAREPEAGKNVDVAWRLSELKAMRFETESGVARPLFNQLINIQAIIQAYETKKLTWTPGMVTYWTKGKQICQPRPFDWDEFEAISMAYDGKDQFWVEGILVCTLNTD